MVAACNVDAEILEVEQGNARLETARAALMALNRRADVAGILALRRVERCAAALAVLARQGFYVETQALGRSFVDALFSAALLTDTDPAVRLERSQRFARGILETQLAGAYRLRKSKTPWLNALYDAAMQVRQAELEQKLRSLGGTPNDSKRIEHWFGNRRDVAKTVGMEDLYESIYQDWNDATHAGAYSIEEMFRHDAEAGRSSIDDSAGRNGAIRALRIVASLLEASADHVTKLADDETADAATQIGG